MSCSVPQTLYCGNAVYDQLLQVTRASLRLVDAGTRELRREWRPPAGLSIDVAAASASQVHSHNTMKQATGQCEDELSARHLPGLAGRLAPMCRHDGACMPPVTSRGADERVI